MFSLFPPLRTDYDNLDPPPILFPPESLSVPLCEFVVLPFLIFRRCAPVDCSFFFGHFPFFTTALPTPSSRCADFAQSQSLVLAYDVLPVFFPASDSFFFFFPIDVSLPIGFLLCTC